MSEEGFAPTEQRSAVRRRYASIAAGGDGCCGSSGTGCSDRSEAGSGAARLGYSAADLASAPEGSNLDLGCGNPTAIASLSEGETVLDLGSGAGFDCFLAAREVGESGRVVGVDMTPEMVERARGNAAEGGYDNVEFRLGEIEHLPVADASIDVAVSNCVINLSPEKGRVFEEVFRVLRPGGRLAASDVVRTGPLPEEVRDDPEATAECVAGAEPPGVLGELLDDAGFADVSIRGKGNGREIVSGWSDERDLGEYLVSATIEAQKPG